MKISDNSIERLRQSISRIVEQNRQLEEDNQKLSRLCSQQQQELEQIKQRLHESESKLKAVMLAGSLVEVSGGTKIARQRVNNLLRDIDRCISLVNK